MDLKFRDCKVLVKKLTENELYQFSGAWDCVAMKFNRFIQEHKHTKPGKGIENTRNKDENNNGKKQKCVSPHLYEWYKTKREKYRARRTFISSSNCNESGLEASSSDTTVRNSKASLEKSEVLIQNSKSIKCNAEHLKPSCKLLSKNASTNSEKPSVEKPDKNLKTIVPDSKTVTFNKNNSSTCKELKISLISMTSSEKETPNSFFRTETVAQSSKSTMPALKERRLNTKITEKISSKNVTSNSKAGTSAKILKQSSKPSASNTATVLVRSKTAKSVRETTSLCSEKLPTNQQTRIISKHKPSSISARDGQSIGKRIVSKSKSPSDENTANLTVVSTESENKIKSSTLISSKVKNKTSSLTAIKSKDQNDTSSVTATKSKLENKTSSLMTVKSKDQNKPSSLKTMKSKDQSETSSSTTMKSKEENKASSLKAMKSTEENKISSSKAVKSKDENKIGSSKAVKSKDENKTLSSTATNSKEGNKTSRLITVKCKDQNKPSSLKAMKSKDQSKTSSSTAMKSKEENKASSSKAMKSTEENKTSSSKTVKSKYENKTSSSKTVKSKDQNKILSSKTVKSKDENKTSSSTAMKSKEKYKTYNSTEVKSKEENKTSSSKTVKSKDEKTSSSKTVKSKDEKTSSSKTVKSKEENKTSSSMTIKSKNENETSKSLTMKSRNENETPSSMIMGSRCKSTNFADSNAKNSIFNSDNESTTAALRAVSAFSNTKIPCSISRTMLSSKTTSKLQAHVTDFKAVQSSSKPLLSDSKLQDSRNHLAVGVLDSVISSPQSIISSTNHGESDDSRGPGNSEVEIKMKIKKLDCLEGRCMCSSSSEVSTVRSRKECKLNACKSAYLSDDNITQKKPIKRARSRGFEEAANKNTQVDNSDNISSTQPLKKRLIEPSSDTSSITKFNKSESFFNCHSLDSSGKAVNSFKRVKKQNERDEKKKSSPLKDRHNHVRRKSQNLKSRIVDLSESCDGTKSTKSESRAYSYSSNDCTKTEQSLKRVKKHTENEPSAKKKSSAFKDRRHVREGCEKPKNLRDNTNLSGTKSESSANSNSSDDCTKTENSLKRVKKHTADERSVKEISNPLKDSYHVHEGSENPKSTTIDLSDNCDGTNFSSTKSTKSESNVKLHSPENSAKTENSWNKFLKKEHRNERKSTSSKDKPHVRGESEILKPHSDDLSDSCDGKSSNTLKTSPLGKRKSREQNSESTPQKKFKQSPVGDSLKKEHEMIEERSSPKVTSQSNVKKRSSRDSENFQDESHDKNSNTLCCPPKKQRTHIENSPSNLEHLGSGYKSRDETSSQFSSVDESHGSAVKSPLKGIISEQNHSVRKSNNFAYKQFSEKQSNQNTSNTPLNCTEMYAGEKKIVPPVTENSSKVSRENSDSDEMNQTVRGELITFASLSSLESASDKVSNNISDEIPNQTSTEVTSKAYESTSHTSSDILSNIMKSMDHLPNYKAKLISNVTSCLCCIQTKVLPPSAQMQYDNEITGNKDLHAHFKHLKQDAIHSASAHQCTHMKICKCCNFQFVSKIKTQVVCARCLNRHKMNDCNSSHISTKVHSGAKHRFAFSKRTIGNLVEERYHHSKILNTSQDGKHFDSLKCRSDSDTVQSQLELPKAQSLKTISEKQDNKKDGVEYGKTEMEDSSMPILSPGERGVASDQEDDSKILNTSQDGKHFDSLKCRSDSDTVQSQLELPKAQSLKTISEKQDNKKDGVEYGKTEMEDSSMPILSPGERGVASDQEDDSYNSMPIITSVVSKYNIADRIIEPNSITPSLLSSVPVFPPVIDTAIPASSSTPILSMPVIPIYDHDQKLTDSKIPSPSTMAAYDRMVSELYQRTSPKSSSFREPVITAVNCLSVDEYSTIPGATGEIKSPKSNIHPSKNVINSKDSDIKIIGKSSIHSGTTQYSISSVSTQKNHRCLTMDSYNDKFVSTSEDTSWKENVEIEPEIDNLYIGGISDDTAMSYTGENSFSVDAEITLNETTDCAQVLSTDLNENRDMISTQKNRDCSATEYCNRKMEEVSEYISDSNSVKLLTDVDNSQVGEISNEATVLRTGDNCISHDVEITLSDSGDSIQVLSSDEDDGCSAAIYLSTTDKALKNSDNLKSISEYASGNKNVDDRQLLKISDKITVLHTGANDISRDAEVTSVEVRDSYEHKNNGNETETAVETLLLEKNSVEEAVPDIAKSCSSYDVKKTSCEIVKDISVSNQSAEVNMVVTSQPIEIFDEKAVSRVNEYCNSYEIEKKSEDIFVSRENIEIERDLETLGKIISHTIENCFSCNKEETADDISLSKKNVEGKMDEETPQLNDICDETTASCSMENCFSCTVEGTSEEILKDVSGSKKAVKGVLGEVQQLSDNCEETALSRTGGNFCYDASQISCDTLKDISGCKESVEGKTDKETSPQNEICYEIVNSKSVVNRSSYDAVQDSNKTPKDIFENEKKTEMENIDICQVGISDEITVLRAVENNPFFYAEQTSNGIINDNSESKKNTEVEMDLKNSQPKEISDETTVSCITENYISSDAASLDKKLKIKCQPKENVSTVSENYGMNIDSELNEESAQKQCKSSIVFSVQPNESMSKVRGSSFSSDKLPTSNELDSDISISDILKSNNEGIVIEKGQNSDEMPSLSINSSSKDITEYNMESAFSESEIQAAALLRCTENVTDQNKSKRFSSLSEFNTATDISQNNETPKNLDCCSENVNSNADATFETNRKEFFDFLIEMSASICSDYKGQHQNISASSFIEYISKLAIADLKSVDLIGNVLTTLERIEPKHSSIQRIKNIHDLSKLKTFENISDMSIEETQKRIAILKEKIEINRLSRSVSLDLSTFRIAETEEKGSSEAAKSISNALQNSIPNLNFNEGNFNASMCNLQENQQNEIPSCAMNSSHFPSFNPATNRDNLSYVTAAAGRTEASNENTSVTYSSLSFPLPEDLRSPVESLPNNVFPQDTQPVSIKVEKTLDEYIENVMSKCDVTENNITSGSSNNVVYNSNDVQAENRTLIDSQNFIVSTNESIGNAYIREPIHPISSATKTALSSVNHCYSTPSISNVHQHLQAENTSRSMPQNHPLDGLYLSPNARNYPVNYSNILPASTLTTAPGNYGQGVIEKRASLQSANPPTFGQNQLSFNHLHYMPSTNQHLQAKDGTNQVPVSHYMPSTNHHQHLQAKDGTNQVPVSHYMPTNQHLQAKNVINHVPISHYPQHSITERSTTTNHVTQSSPPAVALSNGDYMKYAANRAPYKALSQFQNQRETETYQSNITSPPVTRSVPVQNTNMSAQRPIDFIGIQFHQPSAAYSQFPVNTALPQQNPNSFFDPGRTVHGIQRPPRAGHPMRHQVPYRSNHTQSPPHLAHMPYMMASNRNCPPGKVQAPNVTPHQSFFSTRHIRPEQVPQVPSNRLQRGAPSGTETQLQHKCICGKALINCACGGWYCTDQRELTHWRQNLHVCSYTPR